MLFPGIYMECLPLCQRGRTKAGAVLDAPSAYPTFAHLGCHNLHSLFHMVRFVAVKAFKANIAI